MRISDWSSDVCSSDLAVTQTLGELGEREKAHVLVYRATLLAHVLLGYEAKAHVLLASSRLEPLGFARAQCTTGLLHAGTVSDDQQKLYKTSSVLDPKIERDLEIGGAACRERGCQNVYQSRV